MEPSYKKEEKKKQTKALLAQTKASWGFMLHKKTDTDHEPIV